MPRLGRFDQTRDARRDVFEVELGDSVRDGRGADRLAVEGLYE